MLFHIAPGNPVRDTLKAESRKEPIENGRRMARGDSLIQTRVTNFLVDLIEERQGSADCTDGADQSIGIFVWFRKTAGRGSQPCCPLPQRLLRTRASS